MKVIIDEENKTISSELTDEEKDEGITVVELFRELIKANDELEEWKAFMREHRKRNS